MIIQQLEVSLPSKCRLEVSFRVDTDVDSSDIYREYIICIDAVYQHFMFV